MGKGNGKGLQVLKVEGGRAEAMQRSGPTVENFQDRQTLLLANLNLILIPSHHIRPKSCLLPRLGFFYPKQTSLRHHQGGREEIPPNVGKTK